MRAGESWLANLALSNNGKNTPQLVSPKNISEQPLRLSGERQPRTQQ
ncbi:MAG: hypothetical protein LRY40_07670 [Shewanella fodinae]|nr:hypothetical protein [Shewanella fodinae]